VSMQFWIFWALITSAPAAVAIRVCRRNRAEVAKLEAIRQQRSEEALARIHRAVAESADRWARRWDAYDLHRF
jgi:hypothetical protein